MNAKGMWISLGLALAMGGPATAWEVSAEGLNVVSSYPGSVRMGDNYCAASFENATQCTSDVEATLTVRDRKGQVKLTRTSRDRGVESGDSATLFFGTVSLAQGDQVTIEAAACCGKARARSNSAGSSGTTASGDTIDGGETTSSLQATYLIPAGAVEKPLTYNPGPQTAPFSPVFTGSDMLRITEVVTTSGIKLSFAAHTPAMATAYFAANPLPASAGELMLKVSNPDTSDHTLTIGVGAETPTEGACDRHQNCRGQGHTEHGNGNGHGHHKD